MDTVFITGMNSFTGRYVVKALADEGFDSIIGTTHKKLPQEPENLYGVDLCDKEALFSIIHEHKPSYVIHLAAISFVKHDDVSEIYQTNIVGTRNLLEALSTLNNPPQKVLLASSASIYGAPKSLPIAESDYIAPTSDYGVSKYAMELMAQHWAAKLPITLIRPFNYTGVGQAKQFLIPKIMMHFQEKKAKIELGNLDVARDFSDVRTVAQIYAALLRVSNSHDVYNIASGRSISLEEIISLMSEISGHKIEVYSNPEFQRAGEIKNIIGDNQRLLQTLPRIKQYPIAETLRWMYEHSPHS